MTKMLGGDYAAASSGVYHRHIDCTIGEQVPDDPRVWREAARDGRTLCHTCADMTPPRREVRVPDGGCPHQY